ncbi:hypothetical protein [Bradyrhizobium sp. LTSPM299]|nr:hypothetical protein [Bradyrhizobium sp. LTSPM299]
MTDAPSMHPTNAANEPKRQNATINSSPVEMTNPHSASCNPKPKLENQA